MKNSSMLRRARFSLAGLVAAWRRERSFRAHVLFSASLLAVLAGLQPGLVWWAIAIGAIAAGLALEALNGALEALADLVEPGRHPEIGAIKDMASAAAFIANCAIATIATLALADRL